MKNIKLSVLDQSQVRRNGTARQALQESGELIQWAEQLGYTRYWVSEHHNFKMAAGTAPEVKCSFPISHPKQSYELLAGIFLTE